MIPSLSKWASGPIKVIIFFVVTWHFRHNEQKEMVDTPGQMVVLETPGLYQIAKARYLSWKSLERV